MELQSSQIFSDFCWVYTVKLNGTIKMAQLYLLGTSEPVCYAWTSGKVTVMWIISLGYQRWV